MTSGPSTDGFTVDARELPLECVADVPAPLAMLEVGADATGWASPSQAIREIVSVVLPKFPIPVPDELPGRADGDGFFVDSSAEDALVTGVRERGKVVARFDVMRLQDGWLVERYTLCPELQGRSA